MAGQKLPVRSRPRFDRRQPAGRARTSRWPRLGRQQRCTARRRSHCCHSSAERRADRSRLVRRQCDELDRRQDTRRHPGRARPVARRGADHAARLRHYRDRRHGHRSRRLGGDAPRRRGGHPQAADYQLWLGARRCQGNFASRPDPMALCRPPPNERRETIRRRSARFARRVAQGALCRQAGKHRPALSQRFPIRCTHRRGRRAPLSDRVPRHRRCGQRAGHQRLRKVRRRQRRQALADRACPDRRPQGSAKDRRQPHHRLDAANAPDQRPADGRSAAGPQSAGRCLCLGVDAAHWRAAGVRLGLSG